MTTDETHLELISCVLSKPTDFESYLDPVRSSRFAMLFATCNFDVERLLSEMPELSLVGADVPAFICNGKVHEDGAMLLLFRSNQMCVNIAKVVIHQENSIRAALESTIGMNRLASTVLIAFAPGEHLKGPSATRIEQELSSFSGGRLGILGGGAHRVDRKVSRVYFNKEISDDSIVVAALQTNLKYAWGSCDGVIPTGTPTFRPVLQNGLSHAELVRIQKPYYPAPSAFKKKVKLYSLLEGIDFAAVQTTSGQVIVGDNNQPPIITEHFAKEMLRVVQPNGHEMAAKVGRLHESIVNQIDTAVDRIEIVLAMGSFLRYKHRNETGFKVDDALKSVGRSFPKADFCGVYLDGEFRRDSYENICVTHWSLSEIAISNEIMEHAHERLIGQALVDCVQSGRLGNLENAIENALPIVVDSGYPKCMLSLVYENGNTKWIVASAAKGRNWQEIVLPATRRRLNEEGDILDLIVSSGQLLYVSDAQTDPRCKNELAAYAEVISFAGVPVLNQEAKVVGVLQIDLGDNRNQIKLPTSQEFNLKRVGSLVSLLVNQAMLAQEVDFTGELDKILESCLAHEHWVDAYQSFVLDVAKLMNVDVLIRLLGDDGSSLKLIGGIGNYYESSLEHRLVVRLDEQDTLSGAVIAAKSEFPHVVNDTSKDPRHRTKTDKYRGTRLGLALEEIESHADFKIACPNGRLIGTVSLLSTEKWFFDQAKLNSWQDIGKRLSVLHELMEQKAAKNHHLQQLQFIKEITPPIELEQSSHEALRKQVTHIASSSGADIVSCYLFDKSVKRYVLRAQYGWENGRWLDAAWLDEKSVGTTPRLQTMLSRFSCESNLDLMLGQRFLAVGKYDLIHLPLIFKGEQIGVMLLHKLRDANGKNGFSELGFIDDIVLQEAAEILSAFTKALIEHDQTKWDNAELERKQNVLRQLNDPMLAKTRDTFSRFCAGVCEVYRFKHCRVYARIQLEKNQTFVVAGSNNSNDLNRSPDDEVVSAIMSGSARNVYNGPAVDSRIPEQVRQEGQVTRFVVPVRREGRVVVVVDFEWAGMLTKDHHDVLPHHDEKSLVDLSERFADLLITEQLKRREELSFAANDGISLRLRERYHDLANALVAIKENLRSIDESESKSRIQSLVEAELKYFSAIKQSTQQAINRGNRDTCSINQLVSDAVASYQEKIEEYNCRVELNLEEINATVDQSLMAESFRGLVSNALKACKARWKQQAGGLVTIQLAAERTTGTWRFEIVDNGQDYRNSGTPNWGAGLDLTRICCAIHDGKFEISIEPTGTTCRMSVPFEDTTTGLLEFDLG